jgi:hypothetical protein
MSATTIKKAFYRGRSFNIKPNGLPVGTGMFWLNSERKYIYAKVHGKRFSCKTNDWKEALDRIEEKRAEHERQQNGVVMDDVLVSELLAT